MSDPKKIIKENLLNDIEHLDIKELNKVYKYVRRIIAEQADYFQSLLDNNESLTQQLEQSQQRVKELEEAYYSLKELTILKAYKENIGKDDNYLKRQPKAWARAYAAVNKIEGE